MWLAGRHLRIKLSMKTNKSSSLAAKKPVAAPLGEGLKRKARNHRSLSGGGEDLQRKARPLAIAWGHPKKFP